jgi:iron(III) transport system substrate-binding protein
MGKVIIPQFGVVVFLLGNLGIAWAQTDAESILAKINGMAPASRTEALVTEARKEALVQWNSTMPVTDARDVIDRFRKRYPSIEVQYGRMSGTAVVNRLLTEYKAGTPRLDVLGARGDMHPTLMRAGVVAKNDAPFRPELREGFIDKEGYFNGNFTYGLVIGYNTRNVPARRVPTSYQSLLAPEWNGQIGFDLESYEWLGGMIDIMGEEKALDLARRLAAQNLRTVRGHTLLTQLVAAGEIQALLDGYHHQMITFKEKGAPVDFVIPETMIIKEPSGIWITKKAPHPHAAALFVDFLFSKAGQQVYQDGNRLVARRDLEWNFGGKKVNRTHVIDMHKWGQKYDHLIKSFDQIFRKTK